MRVWPLMISSVALPVLLLGPAPSCRAQGFSGCCWCSCFPPPCCPPPCGGFTGGCGCPCYPPPCCPVPCGGATGFTGVGGGGVTGFTGVGGGGATGVTGVGGGGATGFTGVGGGGATGFTGAGGGATGFSGAGAAPTGFSRSARAGSARQDCAVDVSVPAGAKIFVDGEQVACHPSGRQVYSVPNLEPGREYRYTLTGEVSTNGRARSASRSVVVRAGERIAVDLVSALQELHIQRGAPPFGMARLTVKLPAGATLVVNGESKSSVASPRRVFTVSDLELGRTYAYEFELIYPEVQRSPSLRRRVAVRAGDDIEVDLEPQTMLGAR
jgi:uncharacterized protein (TIGR03000 family)